MAGDNVKTGYDYRQVGIPGFLRENTELLFFVCLKIVVYDKQYKLARLLDNSCPDFSRLLPDHLSSLLQT